jgi:hypothetical protein
MHIKHLSTQRFTHTMLWSLLLSALIVAMAATLARASYNFTAALTDKPDLALYLLLPEKDIMQSTLLREHVEERDYLVQTKSGSELIRLKRGPNQWFVEMQEQLH